FPVRWGADPLAHGQKPLPEFGRTFSVLQVRTQYRVEPLDNLGPRVFSLRSDLNLRGPVPDLGVPHPYDDVKCSVAVYIGVCRVSFATSGERPPSLSRMTSATDSPAAWVGTTIRAPAMSCTRLRRVPSRTSFAM